MSHTPLQPPAAVAAVAAEEAYGMVPLSAEQRADLEQRVVGFVNTVVSAEADSAEFKERVSAIHSMGNAELRTAVSVSNRMMERPVNAINQGLMDDKSPVAGALVDLRNTCEELDPSRQGNLLEPRKLLGLIPFGNKLRDYFQRYQSAQTHLNGIIQALLNGQDELRKDNAAIEQERATLWTLMSRLEQYIFLGKRIDEELERRIAEIEAQSPEKARIVKEEMLFYVRQKVQDLLVNLAVNVQTYLSLDVVRKNNLELVKGVDRATTTTIQALRNAVMTAQALANQKLVLDQINALNTTTSSLIQSTAALLKQQGSEVARQAAEPAVQIEALKAAFRDIYESIDNVNNYKLQALDTMKQTIGVLEAEVGKAKQYMSEQRQSAAVAALESKDATELSL